MPEASTRQRPARKRLLNAAAELFYAHGVVGTGIDTITEHAGVARKSLYNNFASKDELVLAYIQARHEEWLELFRVRSRSASTAAERVLAVFDAYSDHANAAYIHGFRGCGLLNAAAELPAGSPGRAEVRKHKEEVEAILLKELRELSDEKTAAALAEQLSFILEGAMSRAGLEGSSRRLNHARTMAATLVNAL